MKNRCISLLCLGLLAHPFLAPAAGEEIRIPANTKIYVVLNEELVGKKKFIEEGDEVGAEIWRDVRIDDRIVARAGTPVLVRVDELKKAKVAGIRGQLTLGAYATKTVEGRDLQLGGGYNKKGKGRIALSAALAGLVFLPLIFIKGKAAKLPEGTVFDAYVEQEASVKIDAAASGREIDLSGVLSALRVEIDYEALESQEKPEFFDLTIFAPPTAPSDFVIDRVNEAPTEPIPLEVVLREESDGESVIRARVGIKTLGRRFAKGINRFDVACTFEGERLAGEVVLDIQF